MSQAQNLILGEEESARYRAVFARSKYLSPGRPDTAYAVKGLARAMAKPTDGDMQRHKRFGRYLKGTPGMLQLSVCAGHGEDISRRRLGWL